MTRLAFAISLVALVFGLTAFVSEWAEGGSEHAMGAVHKAQRETLADRINGACKKGYVVSDWYAFSSTGVVMVTCESKAQDDLGISKYAYKKAVQK